MDDRSGIRPDARPGQGDPTAAGQPVAGAEAVLVHLLCIDDDPVNALLLQAYFRLRRGPALRVASSARQGLAMARGAAPLAVLLDLNLPNMHGLQVLRQLREDPQIRDIPVCMVSGCLLEEGLQQALDQGADAVWQKPLDLRQMDRQLVELLHRHRRTGPLRQDARAAWDGRDCRNARAAAPTARSCESP